MPKNDSVRWQDEELTPACNLIDFTKLHWSSFQTSYDKLAKQLRVPRFSPRFTADAGSVTVYREIQKGERQLAWCPRGISLFANLFPFFARRGIPLMLPEEIGDFLITLGDTELSTWVLWADRYEQSHSGSGVFFLLPNAVHLAYLLARTISLREDGIAPDQAYPFVSSSKNSLVFVKTSTRTRKAVLGVAYVPGEAIYFDAFPIEAAHPNLVTPDAFLL